MRPGNLELGTVAVLVGLSVDIFAAIFVMAGVVIVSFTIKIAETPDR